MPAIALGVGVAVLDRASWGPHALALLGSFATPVLAAAAGLLGGRRLWWLWPPAAAMLWVVAWRAHGLPAQAAEVALVAGACLAIAAAAALVAPAWSLQLGLVVLAALDVVLVWGTPQVEPASKALHGVTLPTAAGATIPKLQDVTFGSAEMGWLDLLAPALLGVADRAGSEAPRRRRHRTRRRRLGTAPVLHLDGARDGADARRAGRRPAPDAAAVAFRAACASPSSPTSTRISPPSRRCWRRSTPTRRTSCGASATSSATARARASAARSSRRAPASASPGTTTSPSSGRSTWSTSAARPASPPAGREEILTAPARAYLEGLEPVGSADGVSLFHASARDPVWEYVLSDEAAEATLALTDTPLVLVGHSHAALQVSLRDGVLDGGLAPDGTELDLAEGRLLLNPGSVGQPRDGDPRAAYLLLDLDAGRASFRRVEYDIARTQAEILEAGLPEPLALRLSSGQ